MKKIIMLFLVIIVLTGCSAEVNINIGENGINETITINDTSSTNYYNYVPVFYDDIFSEIEPDVKNEGVSYYNKNVTHNVNGYKINYSYKYTFDEYKKARSVKTSFKSFNLRKSDMDEEIVISTDSGGLQCFNAYSSLDSVKINIIPSYNVKESNADFVNGNVYTWIFNRTTKKNIYMLLDNPNNSSSSDNNSSNGDSNNGNSSSDNNSVNNNDNNNNNENDHLNETINEKDSSKKDEKSFIDKYPFVILFGAIIIFLMLFLVLFKVSKSE